MTRLWVVLLALIQSVTAMCPLNENDDSVGLESTRRLGSVDFAFDGGTIQCTFGTKTQESMVNVAMIVHPTSMQSMIDRKAVVSSPETKGSAVIAMDPDGTYRQLDLATGLPWVQARIAEMSSRESSVAENAFIAAATHTLATGTPIRVWSHAAVDKLESGNWSALFSETEQPEPEGFSERNPFEAGR